jgi:hypothetical protein
MAKLTDRQKEDVRSALTVITGADCKVITGAPNTPKSGIDIFQLAPKEGGETAESLKTRLDAVITEAGLGGTAHSFAPVKVTARGSHVDVSFMDNELHFPPATALKMLGAAQKGSQLTL